MNEWLDGPRIGRRPLEDRISPEPMSGCWLWTGPRSDTGYGRVGGKKQRAHRVVYERLRGPIPEGLHLDHLCRTPLCVNPDHLEPVTCRQNILRGVGPTAVNAGKTVCKRGHALTGRNVILRGGMRSCRVCVYAHNAAANRLRRARAKANAF